MGDETDWKKLSTQEKCEHKVIKYFIFYFQTQNKKKLI